MPDLRTENELEMTGRGNAGRSLYSPFKTMNTPSEPTKPTTDLPPTITLAKLYEKQGFLEAAADIYRQLIARDPTDQALKTDLEAVEERIRDGIEAESGRDPGRFLSVLRNWHRVIQARKEHLVSGRATAKLLFIHVTAEDPGDYGLPTGEHHEGAGQAGNRVEDRSDVVVASVRCDSEQGLAEGIRGAEGNYDAVIIQCDRDEICRGEMVRQALLSLTIPVIEIVPTNVYAENPSLKPAMADAVTGQLLGFGEDSYAVAVKTAAGMVRDKKIENAESG